MNTSGMICGPHMCRPITRRFVPIQVSIYVKCDFSFNKHRTVGWSQQCGGQWQHYRNWKKTEYSTTSKSNRCPKFCSRGNCPSAPRRIRLMKKLQIGSTDCGLPRVQLDSETSHEGEPAIIEDLVVQDDKSTDVHTLKDMDETNNIKKQIANCLSTKVMSLSEEENLKK
ncbi:Hypothetical predicted protein [Olea europaea subsp. europaea]|uniref:Uncharacterized protein n=1 Tax=Olea europaea subsp. europaea TaxID=158383 RepID=A0A8S0RU30_OLEEU|nr:Hypothetical predicted protein [Olea europaea subsp. europaea]